MLVLCERDAVIRGISLSRLHYCNSHALRAEVTGFDILKIGFEVFVFLFYGFVVCQSVLVKATKLLSVVIGKSLNDDVFISVRIY